jgi:hypothetical protein
MTDPFTVLGLPASPDLTDEQVRAAWRTLAAATHPDRADGGDPARYAAVSAAFAQLRTAWQRTEALADLTTPATSGPPPPVPAPPGSRTLAILVSLRMLPARARHGRPLHLAIRAIGAAGLALLAVRLIAGTASAPAVATGAALWFAFTARADLAPPPGR